MKRIFTSILLLFSIVLFSQEDVAEREDIANPIKIGVKGGISLPKLTADTDNIYSRDFKSFTAFEAGVFANYGFSELLSLQVELNYTIKGGERKGNQPVPAAQLPASIMLPPGSVVYADFENKSVLEYIEIPVLAKFTFGDDWKFFGNIGPYAGFLIGATQKTSGSSDLIADIPGVGDTPVFLPEPVSFDAETDVKDDIKNFNFGGIVGVGVIKNLGANSEVFFEARGTYGFIAIQEDETFGKSKIGSFVFSLGYAYKL